MAKLLKDWRQPASQHDVVDFMEHVFRIMMPPQLQYSWEARLGTPQGIVCQDRGLLSSPIVLHLDTTHRSLQDCINAWSHQAHPHALSTAVNVLIIQLARYRCRGGLTFKHRQDVAIPATLRIPVFGRGLHTFHAVYSVAAIILHHGAHTRAGHYTAILCDDRGQFWETDDGRQARPSEGLPSTASCDGYVIALIRRC